MPNGAGEAGLETRIDAVGSVWGRLPGTEAHGKAVVSGSHIDSQTPGGRYDGALGAIAGLVAIRALKEQFGPPRRLKPSRSARKRRAAFLLRTSGIAAPAGSGRTCSIG